MKRIEWYVNGLGIHHLSPSLFASIPTERLCELYNIDLKYFRNC